MCCINSCWLKAADTAGGFVIKDAQPTPLNECKVCYLCVSAKTFCVAGQFTCTQMVLNVALKAASFDCTREEGVGRLCKWLQQPHLLRPHQSWGHSHEQLQRPSLHNTSEAYTIHVNVKSFKWLKMQLY